MPVVGGEADSADAVDLVVLVDPEDLALQAARMEASVDRLPADRVDLMAASADLVDRAGLRKVVAAVPVDLP